MTQRNGREVFDWATDQAHKLFPPESYSFVEFVMPDGRIERWWSGSGESFTLVYKDDWANVRLRDRQKQGA